MNSFYSWIKKIKNKTYKHKTYLLFGKFKLNGVYLNLRIRAFYYSYMLFMFYILNKVLTFNYVPIAIRY